MFTVIGIMFCGIAVGYFFRKVELLQKIGKPISYTILLLLFLLGISVGANESIVNNLTTLGGQALLIASAGTLGSVLAAWGSSWASLPWGACWDGAVICPGSLSRMI